MSGIRVDAWRCRACTCLTIHATTEPAPRACDRCGGPLDPFQLTHTTGPQGDS